MEYRKASDRAHLESLDGYELAPGNLLVQIDREEKTQAGFVQYGQIDLNRATVVGACEGHEHRIGSKVYFTRGGILPIEIDGVAYAVVPFTAIKMYHREVREH